MGGEDMADNGGVDVSKLAEKAGLDRAELIRRLAEYDIVVQHGEISNIERVSHAFGRAPLGEAARSL
jgi:hypothetical protein